jgi:hypothetical protein
MALAFNVIKITFIILMILNVLSAAQSPTASAATQMALAFNMLKITLLVMMALNVWSTANQMELAFNVL